MVWLLTSVIRSLEPLLAFTALTGPNIVHYESNLLDCGLRQNEWISMQWEYYKNNKLQLFISLEVTNHTFYRLFHLKLVFRYCKPACDDHSNNDSPQNFSECDVNKTLTNNYEGLWCYPHSIFLQNKVKVLKKTFSHKSYNTENTKKKIQYWFKRYQQLIY